MAETGAPYTGPRACLGVAALMVLLSACTGTIMDSGDPAGGSPGAIGGESTMPTTLDPASVPLISDQDPAANTPLSDITCTVDNYAPARILRLSAAQYVNTMRATFGYDQLRIEQFPRDGINDATGFNNDARANFVGDRLAELYFQSGASIAQSVVAELPTTQPCVLNGADTACLEAFVRGYAERAFSRPLSVEEVGRYAELFQRETAAHDPATAAEIVVSAIAQSPHAVYRTELGDGGLGVVEMTQYEKAAALAYLLTDAPPDEALLQAAAQGSLNDAAVVSQQAERLLQSAAARGKLNEFFYQYLKFADLVGGDQVELDLANAMVDESLTFVEQVVWERQQGLIELFTAPYTFVGPELAEHYGLDASGTQSSEVALDPTQRAGLLTQGGVLSAVHDPVHRGLFVRQDLLCQKLPTPPPGAAAMTELLEGEPDDTPRDVYLRFKDAVPACDSCHSQFQPLGLGFENFDEQGRYRTSYAGSGKQVLPEGELNNAGDASGPFENALGLVRQITESQTGQRCFVKRTMSYAYRRPINTAEEACAILRIGDRFSGAGAKPQELLLALTRDPGFFKRVRL